MKPEALALARATVIHTSSTMIAVTQLVRRGSLKGVS